MIIIKTEMKDLPNSCKVCAISVKGYGNTMCPILHDWLEPFEIRNGKEKLDECPLIIMENIVVESNDAKV